MSWKYIHLWLACCWTRVHNFGYAQCCYYASLRKTRALRVAQDQGICKSKFVACSLWQFAVSPIIHDSQPACVLAIMQCTTTVQSFFELTTELFALISWLAVTKKRWYYICWLAHIQGDNYWKRRWGWGGGQKCMGSCSITLQVGKWKVRKQCPSTLYSSLLYLWIYVNTAWVQCCFS